MRDPEYSLNFDVLLDAMNQIKLRDDVPLEGSFDKRDEQSMSMTQGFNMFQGINQLVYDDQHDYLKDLQTQQKKKAYPSMFHTSTAFNELLFPASNHNIEERSKRYKAVTSTPKWTVKKRINALSLDPAGARIPKDFKKR